MKTDLFTFISENKTLSAVLWLPEGKPKAVLQITHGMTEHIGKYGAFAEQMAAHGIAVCGFDLRGHGKNGDDEEVASFGKGGTGAWGGTVAGAVLPYHYNVPQTPLLTTVDVATYDSIAEFTPSLEKIYDNVFNEGYRAGDPNTYAHKLSDLKNVDGTVLQGKNGGNSNDGFLSNSSVSTAGGSQSQVIAVEEEEASSIGWGVAVENTSIAKVSVAKVGFTISAEHNSSYVTTTTKGQE